VSLPAINFFDNTMTSLSCRVKSRSIVTFTIAKARSSGTKQSRPSYLKSSCSSLYDILDIPADTSNQEIKAIYWRLAKVYHPDVAAINQKNLSADEFMEILVAYSTLSDPDKHIKYNQSLFWRQRS